MSSRPHEVLLIDDDPAMRSMLVRALTRAGYVVHQAGDGREGLKVLDGHEVSLVVTDIIMPDVEGVELIFRLKKTHPGLPVIAMSGGGRMSPKGYLDVAKSCGAARTISKPFDLQQLLDAIAELLAGSTKPAPPGSEPEARA